MTDSHQKQHYDKVARNHGTSGLSSIKDQSIRDAELLFITTCLKKYAKENSSILDLGCGNGHTLKTLRHTFPQAHLFGLEFHEEMYHLAIAQNIEDCTLWHDDMVLSQKLEPEQFDFIITERSLINILNLKNRPKVCEQIYRSLKPNGFYLMIESFTESWIKMNEARAEFHLPEIPVSAHNKYLNEDTIKIFLKRGFKEREHELGRHYLSTHFYITRVWHPAIRTSDSPMDNSHFSKFFTRALPAGIGNYSPIQFRLFQKND